MLFSSRRNQRFSKGDLVRVSRISLPDVDVLGIVLGSAVLYKGGYEVFLQGLNTKDWFFPVNMELIRRAANPPD